MDISNICPVDNCNQKINSNNGVMCINHYNILPRVYTKTLGFINNQHKLEKSSDSLVLLQFIFNICLDKAKTTYKKV